MYIGRFVAGGKLEDGSLALAYRVSSRSFPDRRIATGADRASVIPVEGSAATDNVYISYCCARICGSVAAISNGSHTDPIFERLVDGMPPLEAISMGLTALGYERDEQGTPRIFATADTRRDELWFGIIAADRLVIRSAPLREGAMWVLSTNELLDPASHQLPVSATGAAGLAAEVTAGTEWSSFEHPVAAVALVASDGEWRAPSLPTTTRGTDGNKP